MNTFCAYYNQGTCRSCTRIELPFPAQIEAKVQRLRAALAPYGSVIESLVASKPTGFRNKAKFAVTGTLEKPLIGLVGEDDKDTGREILSCPLHLPWINETIKALVPLIQSAKLVPYSIQERTGELKGIIIFYVPETNEGYIRLVLRSQESVSRIPKHLSPWLKDHPAVKSFSVNIQPVPHAILEGTEEIFLLQGPVHLRLNQLDVPITAQGFVQTNQSVAQELYGTARAWIDELDGIKFLELFSGQGAFSFYVSDVVKGGLGIEINPDAAESANVAAKALGLHHLRFIAKDAKDVASELKTFAPDILLVNPPRRGLGEGLSLVKNSGVPNLIYSSCSLESLVKDLKELSDCYQVVRAKPFDMFPHSDHFETLVLLTLNASEKSK